MYEFRFEIIQALEKLCYLAVNYNQFGAKQERLLPVDLLIDSHRCTFSFLVHVAYEQKRVQVRVENLQILCDCEQQEALVEGKTLIFLAERIRYVTAFYLILYIIAYIACIVSRLPRLLE